MKPVQISLSASDVEVLLFALSIFPSFEFEGVSDAQHEINTCCCISAAEKLAAGKGLGPNEFRVVSASLELANDICKGDLDADPEILADCKRYLFSINRLCSAFSSGVEPGAS